MQAQNLNILTFDSLTDLRNHTPLKNQAAFVKSQKSLYVHNSDSTEADDGDQVIKPGVRHSAESGRWKKC